MVVHAAGSYRVFNTTGVLAHPPVLLAQMLAETSALSRDQADQLVATNGIATTAVVTETLRGHSPGEVMIGVLDKTQGTIEVLQSLLPY